MSGLAEVEAGISGAELARQLAARGSVAGPDNFDHPGRRIAQRDAPWLQS